jgi:hypothetical protein
VSREPLRQEPADVGGPLVALCAGPRCSALRRLAGTADTVEVLGEAVRGTPGAVLLTTGCPGACALSSLAVVGHRAAGSRTSGTSLLLSGVQTPERVAALAAWVAHGGPGPAGHRLPADLRDAVAGSGPPLRLGPLAPGGPTAGGDGSRSPAGEPVERPTGRLRRE